MGNVLHCLYIFVLVAAYSTEGFLDQEKETWPCVCDPGGLIGTQVYTGDERQGFTDCSCSSECAFCPAGEILDPSTYKHNTSCGCVPCLFVIVRLLQLRISNYTSQMENAFLANFSSLMGLASSQVIPVRRQNGSVILDMYVCSSSQIQLQLQTVASTIVKMNTSLDDLAEMDLLGPWKVIYIGTFGVDADPKLIIGKESHGRLIVIVLLCATMAVGLLLISLILWRYKSTRRGKGVSFFWFDEDSNPSGLSSLISHSSSQAESFQVYENSCFSGATGCIGRPSLKATSKMGLLLGSMTRQFSYEELWDATQGFCKSNIVGMGGSSCVYKGQLKDKRDIAVKKLTSDFVLGLDREFLLEVELLSRLHHFHLVPLIGYCIDKHGGNVTRMLVYEFMPNGNLREHLNQTFGKETLNWTSRLRIALGAARGLEYLHEAADPRVLHRDFKSSNILLDAKWRAKVSDFGMATTLKEIDCSACPSSPPQILGTFGYFAPEYAMMGRATTKSDVFSFGVVLLELLSGRKPLDRTLPPSQESLVVWALPLLRNTMRLVTELVDPALHHGLPVDDAQKMAHLAWLCLQMDPESRPTMTFVVQLLASLIPESSTKLYDSAHVTDKGPRLLSCVQDYNFSRQDETQLSVFSLEPFDQSKPSRRFNDTQLHILDAEQDMILKQKVEPNQGSLSSISLSAAEYLEKFVTLTFMNTRTTPVEDEADLVSPRMEYFWLNNGLMAQVQQ